MTPNIYLARRSYTQIFFPSYPQGAQSVGMAKDLVADCPAAKALFDKASGILGYDLLQVCVEGEWKQIDAWIKGRL